MGSSSSSVQAPSCLQDPQQACKSSPRRGAKRMRQENARLPIKGGSTMSLSVGDGVSPGAGEVVQVELAEKDKPVNFLTMQGELIMYASLGHVCPGGEDNMCMAQIKQMFLKTTEETRVPSFVYGGCPLDDAMVKIKAPCDMFLEDAALGVESIDIYVLFDVAESVKELQELESKDAAKLSAGWGHHYIGIFDDDSSRKIDVDNNTITISNIPANRMLEKDAKTDKEGRLVYKYEKPQGESDKDEDLLLPALNLEFLVEKFWHARKLQATPHSKGSTARPSSSGSGSNTSASSTEPVACRSTEKPEVESITISVEVNSDAGNNGLGIKVAPKNMGFAAEDALKEANKGCKGYVYSSGLADKDDPESSNDGVRNFTVKFHPGMHGGQMRVEGHATNGRGNQNVGYMPQNWTQSGNKFHTIAVTLRTPQSKEDNVVQLTPPTFTDEVKSKLKPIPFGGRYTVIDRHTLDTFMPAVYAHKDCRGGGPVYYGNISIQLKFAQ